MINTEKTIVTALQGKATKKVPFWLMRQAGRYLPEYRELRRKAGGFLDMVYNPERAAEVTMQPIRRFGMQGAILFSDILVVPHALDVKLEFVAGEGPKLEPLRDEADLTRLDDRSFGKTVAPVYETVARVRASLQEEGFDDTALIGFAGAPWTVACYMVEGGGSRDFHQTKSWAYRDPDSFQKLIDILVEHTSAYLLGQIQAGAEAIKIFDSWAGILDEENFRRWVIAPTAKIVETVRTEYPHIPVIGFPRGAGFMAGPYSEETGVDTLALDQMVPLERAKELQKARPVQGNLDPLHLLNGGTAMKDTVERILRELSGGPFVFNLGHGVIKETPPEHVAKLAEIIKGYQP